MMIIHFHFILKASSILSVLIRNLFMPFPEELALHIFFPPCYFQASL